MAQERDLYERVNAAIAERKLWRAKEILQGNIGKSGYDCRLFERYGEVLARMGDLVEAGKYLFLSGERKPEHEEAIGLYLARFTRNGPAHLLSTFPKAARLARLADYPEAVRRALEELRASDSLLARAPHYTRKEVTRTSRAFGIGCLVILAILCVCLIVGGYEVVTYIVKALF